MGIGLELRAGITSFITSLKSEIKEEGQIPSVPCEADDPTAPTKVTLHYRSDRIIAQIRDGRGKLKEMRTFPDLHETERAYPNVVFHAART